MTPTPEERAKLRALHQNATQGEWRTAEHLNEDVGDVLIVGENESLLAIYERNDGDSFANLLKKADLYAIVAAHNALPGLLDALDAADVTINDMTATLNDTNGKLDAAEADKIRLAADGSHAVSERNAARENAAYWQGRAVAAEKEIARLKAGGCARGDQHTTQHCAEAAGLAAENKRLKEEVAAYECWMRDVIKTDACWPDGPQCVPTLTQELYDRFLDIRPDGKTFQPDHATLLAEVATLKAQREALLKAAKDTLEAFIGDKGLRKGIAMQALYDAIAAAEGEAKP